MRRDFGAYMATPRFDQWRPSTEFRQCLKGKDFKTLGQFRRWARETFPDFYRSASFQTNFKSGKEIIDAIWADFQRWQATR
jgi:hypothetical protein